MLADRFWSDVDKHGPTPNQSLPFYSGLDACWLWRGLCLSKGHGHLSFNGSRNYAHRVSWILHYGEIPFGSCVLHKCDNPPCVNPKHLFLGSRADNARDAASKGRMRAPKAEAHWTRQFPHRVLRGELHGRTRLSPSVVSEVRLLAREGLSQRAIAARFGIGRNHVFRIIHKQSWAHI
jgi:hypothetical protein